MKTITENKIFEKAFREMEIFENAIFLYSCGRVKMNYY